MHMIPERHFVTTTLAPAATPVVAPTGRGRLRLVLILGALIALGPLTIDMYLPALPTIVGRPRGRPRPPCSSR